MLEINRVNRVFSHFTALLHDCLPTQYTFDKVRPSARALMSLYQPIIGSFRNDNADVRSDVRSAVRVQNSSCYYGNIDMCQDL